MLREVPCIINLIKTEKGVGFIKIKNNFTFKVDPCASTAVELCGLHIDTLHFK